MDTHLNYDMSGRIWEKGAYRVKFFELLMCTNRKLVHVVQASEYVSLFTAVTRYV